MNLWLVISCIVTFILRLAPRIFFSKTVQSDTFFHLAIAKKIQKYGWRHITRMRPTYPMGYHRLLALLPSQFFPLWERINGAVFDTLLVLTFAFLLSYTTGSQVETQWKSFWGPVLLGMSPALLAVSYGPRAYDGTERIVAEWLMGMTFGAIWLFQITHAWIWWLLAVVIGACCLNVSKFAAQVLLSFTLILSIAQRSYLVAAVFPSAFILAHWISGGAYRYVWQGQLRHLRWYAKAVVTQQAPVADRNTLTKLRWRYRTQGWQGVVYYILFENSITIGLLHHLPFFVILVWFGKIRYLLSSGDFPAHWWLAGSIMWILTSWRPLLFLGESERYLLYAVIPEYYLLTIWLMNAEIFWRLGVLLYSLIWWMGQMYIFKRHRHWVNPHEQEDAELITFLNSIPPQRLFTFAWSFTFQKIAYMTHHHHIFLDLIAHANKYNWGEIFIRYPFPRWAAVRQLRCEILVVRKADLAHVQAQGMAIDIPFQQLPCMFENKAYMVFQVNPAAAHMPPRNTMTIAEHYGGDRHE